MSITALPKVPSGTLQRIWWMLVTVPYRALGLYTPNGLLAIPAAYASSQWAAHRGVFPPPFNMMLGIAFEWVYLGTLAVAGALPRNRWFVTVNAIAVVSSVIYVTLHAADKYGQLDKLTSSGWQWTFAVIHGLPLAVLNFCYSMLVHTYLRHVNETEALVAHKCPWCGQGFKSPAAVNGHQKGCPQKP